MFRTGRVEQHELPGFPPVAHKYRLFPIRQERSGWVNNTWTKLEHGWPATFVLFSLFKAYPYIRKYSLARVGTDTDAGWFDKDGVTLFDTTETSPIQAVTNFDRLLPRRSGWDRNNLATALLSRVELDDGSAVHFPIMHFQTDSSSGSEEIAEKLSKHFRGYLFSDDVKAFYFLGSDLLPRNRWLEFIDHCRFTVPYADRFFCDRVINQEVVPMRLTRITENLPAPRVLKIIS